MIGTRCTRRHLDADGSPSVAAVLAGGLGTRLKPLTDGRPKVMVELNGRPFIRYVLELLRENGIVEVVLCIGQLGGVVRDYVGDGRQLGLRVSYACDDPPCGTAAALRAALPLLPTEFIVVNGDTYLEMDYTSLARFRNSTGLRDRMVIYRNENRFWRSNVETLGNRVIAYGDAAQESGADSIDAGVALLAAETLREGPPVDGLPQLYARMARDGRLGALEVPRRFYEINTASSLREAEQYLGRRVGAGRP